ncbi:MAG TPA: CDP-diacylglycerol diphosphatase [Myxococcota bacterium]|nr:CDP-diacylglycerol diphosphatase [Myxococcota bacterium]
MKRNNMRRPVVVVALLLAAGCLSAAHSRNILLGIVTDCLNPGELWYCSRCASPQAGYCGDASSCERTTEVWSQSKEYVAIRDIKMCSCPEGFVHGLAMPRFPVTGVEDVRRPDGLWSFAWNAAQSRIADPSEIALVVNPPGKRTQDQLHVHLVRLTADARTRVTALEPVRVERLEDTWMAAAANAWRRRIASYGVIVIRSADGGWLVAADSASPEADFTIARCGL